MRFLKPLVVQFLLLISGYAAQAQLLDKEDESRLYAETKQVNQFFRRFNGEESEKGDRYYPKDKLYRTEKLRKKYLGMLFDASNTSISGDLKVQFARDVLEKTPPTVLEFHGGSWFAEVNTTFTLYGKSESVTLFMELEKAQEGTKWVINSAHADVFDPYFKRDTMRVGKFMHPMSHELDFMNLRKAFNYTDSIAQFSVKRFRPDHLTLLFYEVKRGNMKFKTVESVKFHFFQVKGWYFEISEFNRSGFNNGWLISNLVKLNNDQERKILQRYLYYEGR